MKQLPSLIHTGIWRGGHIQGIAIDKKRVEIRGILCYSVMENKEKSMGGSYAQFNSYPEKTNGNK